MSAPSPLPSLWPFSIYFIAFLISFNLIFTFPSLKIETLAAGNLIINEFVPFPSGRECSPHDGLEKIELFNNGDEGVDLNNFNLRNKAGAGFMGTAQVFSSLGVVLPGARLVPVGGYAVFYTSEWLSNTSPDGVYLYQNEVLVNSQDYSISGSISDLVYRRNNLAGGGFTTGLGSTFGRSNETAETPGCPPNSSSSSSLSSASINASAISSSVNLSSSSSSNSSSSSSILSSSSLSSGLNSSSNPSSSNSDTISSLSSNSSLGSNQFGRLEVCKEDVLTNRLANWQFELKGQANNLGLSQKTGMSFVPVVVETLTLQAANPSQIPSMSLPAGNYQIKVSGVYTYYTDTQADAGYSVRPEFGNTWVSGDDLPSPITENLKVRINNQNVNWGSYNSGHVYTIALSKNDDLPINFSILDTVYEDNRGLLTVEIIELVEQNGCTIFDNLPYGNYTLSEIMQPGWRFKTLKGVGINSATGNGTINYTIDQPENQITFVNEKIPAASNSGIILYPTSPNTNTNGSNRPTAVKGVEDNESDSSSQNNTSNNQNSSSQSQTKVVADNSISKKSILTETKLEEVEVILVPKIINSENLTTISKPAVSTLVRTGGSQHLEFVAGILLILMGSGLYISFQNKEKVFIESEMAQF